MNKKEQAFIVSLIRKTTAFRVGHLSYKRNIVGSIVVWEKKPIAGCFYAVEIIAGITPYAPCYINYNEDKKRAELVIH